MSEKKKLTPIEERIYAYQMSFDHVGAEGQERIANTNVAILGLSAIGLAVVRALVASGIGKLLIIDNSTVTENTLGAQSTFDANDLGKIKGLALKEKELGKSYSEKIDILATQFTKYNSHTVLPRSYKTIIDTSYDFQVTSDIFDVADDKGLHVAGAVANGWEGVFGIYAGDNPEFKEIISKYYFENKNIGKDRCLSVTSFCLGGLLTSVVIRDILKFEEKESKLFKYDLYTQEIIRIL